MTENEEALIKKIFEALDKLESGMGEIKEGTISTRKTMNEGFKGIRERLDSIEKKLDRIEKKLESQSEIVK